MLPVICVAIILALANAQPSGKFYIFQKPSSLDFHGSDELPSQFVGDVISTCIGYEPTYSVNWNGLEIKNPFAIPGRGLIVFVEGDKELANEHEGISYDLSEKWANLSLNGLVDSLKYNNATYCDLNFAADQNIEQSFRNCFAIDLPGPYAAIEVPIVYAEGSMKVLQRNLMLLNEVSNQLDTAFKNPKILLLRLSIQAIASEYGRDSEAMAMAQRLVDETIANMNYVAASFSEDDNFIFFVITNYEGPPSEAQLLRGIDATGGLRYRRSDNGKTDEVQCDENFIPMFHIILWTSVGLIFALIAICYTLYNMTSEDGTIYRSFKIARKED